MIKTFTFHKNPSVFLHQYTHWTSTALQWHRKAIPQISTLTHDNYFEQFDFFIFFFFLLLVSWEFSYPENLWCGPATSAHYHAAALGTVFKSQSVCAMAVSVQWRRKATDESLLNVCTSHPCYLNNALLGKQSWDTFFDRCDWFRDWKAEAKAETTEMHRSQLQTSWLLREILSVGAGTEFPWEKSEMNR